MCWGFVPEDYIILSKKPLNCWNEISEESVGNQGLARAGDLCLHLWEASDPSVRLVELNYKHAAERALSSDAAQFFFLMQWKLQVQTLDGLP